METAEFHRLFVKVYPKLLVYTCCLVGEEEAEDIVQEVFMNLWMNNYKVTEEEQAEKILFRSVYNRALNVCRHNKISAEYSDAVKYFNKVRLDYYDPDRHEVIAAIENKQLGNKIKEAIDALPPKSKKAFTLSYIYGIKEIEIAELMGISVRTVEVHIYRALHFLREKLAE